MKKLFLIIVLLLLLTVSACAEDPSELKTEATQSVSTDQHTVTETNEKDKTYVRQEGIEVIYLAGGCFWGTEMLMQSIPGVEAATSGYANGAADVVPTYEIVKETNHKETVRVEYRPDEVSLDAILFAYFRSIDTTLINQQGNDFGTQYQAGIYWGDDAAKQTALRVADVERLQLLAFPLSKPL